MYYHRTLESTLLRAAEEFPAVSVTGPRQVGKTTMLKHVFGTSAKYVSLDTPLHKVAAKNDPVGFLDSYSPPVIFDEIQNVPELLPDIKNRIDENRALKGQYFLSGSQNLLLSQHVTESLAGRIAILRLFPFTRKELLKDEDDTFPWERKKALKPGQVIPNDNWRSILRGGYPDIALRPRANAALWFDSYVQTYLERDVRILRQLGDLHLFQVFLQTIMLRSSQLTNLSEISKELGVSLNTIKAWLSILVATYQVLILPPYFRNAGKRLVKSPKLFVLDTGLLCHLAGLQTEEQAKSNVMSGAIVETAVVCEIYRRYAHRGFEPRLYFWRTSEGNEVDLVIESGMKLIPIEIKQTSTPRPEMAKGIETFRSIYGDQAQPGYVIHLGNEIIPLGNGNLAVPFGAL